nr:hypothetical protein [uncultured Flavobacterium sp.]
MFNRKLKTKISELEKQLSDANKKISERDAEIKALKFQIDNPPKYKVGDKVGDFIVTEKKFWTPNLPNIIADGILIIAVYMAIYNSKGKMNDDLRKKYAGKIINQWEYEVVNVKTGQKSKKKEFELINESGV